MDEQVDEAEEHVAPTDAMRDAFGKIGELRAYAQQYISARFDLAKVKARNLVILIVLGIVALLAVITTLVVALAMMLSGLAGAIGAALGGRMWAGDLIVGGGLVALFAGGATVGIGLLKRSWTKALVRKYELAEKQQQQNFGRSRGDQSAKV